MDLGEALSVLNALVDVCLVVVRPILNLDAVCGVEIEMIESLSHNSVEINALSIIMSDQFLQRFEGQFFVKFICEIHEHLKLLLLDELLLLQLL